LKEKSPRKDGRASQLSQSPSFHMNQKSTYRSKPTLNSIDLQPSDEMKRFASTSRMFMPPQSMRQSFEDQWSLEQEKQEKYNKKRVFKAQQILELEHSKQLQEKAYEERIKKIDEKQKEVLKTRKLLKQKHTERMETAKYKQLQI